jgi:two-component system CheB/CheR fusion protein
MPHDLFTESPYSDLDLIMCRNVLIHFEHHVRESIIMNFLGSLRNRGLLVLGKSEALSEQFSDLFELVEPKSKIYRKKPQEEPYEGGLR